MRGKEGRGGEEREEGRERGGAREGGKIAGNGRKEQVGQKAVYVITEIALPLCSPPIQCHG